MDLILCSESLFLVIDEMNLQWKIAERCFKIVYPDMVYSHMAKAQMVYLLVLFFTSLLVMVYTPII